MIKLFEAFKKYHNANYHDGDDTFDDEVYKKSNGDDFYDPFVQECFDHFETAWKEQQKLIIEALSLISEYEYGVLDFPIQKIKKALTGDNDE